MRTALAAACALALVGSLGVVASRAGDAPQSQPATSTASAAAKVDPAAASASSAKSKGSVAQSGTCLKTTGSLIRPRPGHCVNAFGNTYTEQDLEKTGRFTAAGALRTLSPIVTIVH